MQQSTNYNFNLPEATDFADISDLSANWEDVDEIIHDHVTSEVTSDDGTHGIRLHDGKLQTISEGNWVDIPVYADIGVLAQLLTTDKDSLVSALNELFTLYTDKTRRSRKNITANLTNLPTAVATQNLEKYGYTIGDYFTGASGYTYILGDKNPFKGTTTPYCISGNHLGIVVDTHQTSQWHTGDASNVGYAGSVLHSYLAGTVLDNIKSDIAALFGDWQSHLISHSKLLTTALANWAWATDQYISALTCTQLDAGSQWLANGFQEGEASKSLELFRKYKWTEIFGGEYPWTRCLSNYSGGSYACYASHNGTLTGDNGVTNAYYAVGLINFH